MRVDRLFMPRPGQLSRPPAKLTPATCPQDRAACWDGVELPWPRPRPTRFSVSVPRWSCCWRPWSPWPAASWSSGSATLSRAP